MAMSSTPAHWTNKKCQSSVQAVSQLSLSQAPCGFAAHYGSFAIFLACSNCLKTAKLHRLEGHLCNSATTHVAELTLLVGDICTIVVLFWYLVSQPFFASCVSLLQESYAFVQRCSYVSCISLIWDILRLGTNFLWCVPLSWMENSWFLVSMPYLEKMID